MSLKVKKSIIFIFADNVTTRYYNIITYHKVSGTEMSVRVLPVILQGIH